MKVMSGEIVVSGRVAYVPQHPWIINDSLRENILLGSDFHKGRLDTIIDAMPSCSIGVESEGKGKDIKTHKASTEVGCGKGVWGNASPPLPH